MENSPQTPSSKLHIFAFPSSIATNCLQFFSSTQIYLPEFVKYIRDPIPCKARLYLDFESDEPLPDFLTSEAVAMQRLYVETSIIASPLNDDGSIQETDSDDCDSNTVDIPIR